MLRVGLTGGIASGKSSVARALVARGVPVVDADALYHRLVAPTGTGPSPLAAQVGAAFPGTLTQEGTLDRRTLGQAVFADPTARERLEAITHPAVAAAAEAAFVELAEAGAPLALYDVPLLYERDLAGRFAGVVVVWVPKDVQRERLAQRDNLRGEAAEARFAAQLPLDDKRARADWVVDNSGTPEATLRQVDALCAQLQQLAARRA